MGGTCDCRVKTIKTIFVAEKFKLSGKSVFRRTILIHKRLIYITKMAISVQNPMFKLTYVCLFTIIRYKSPLKSGTFYPSCTTYIARVVSGKKKFEHITGVLKDLNWLSAHQLVQYHRVQMIRKVVTLELPESLYDIFTDADHKHGHDYQTRQNNRLRLPFRLPLDYHSIPRPFEPRPVGASSRTAGYSYSMTYVKEGASWSHSRRRFTDLCGPNLVRLGPVIKNVFELPVCR